MSLSVRRLVSRRPTVQTVQTLLFQGKRSFVRSVRQRYERHTMIRMTKRFRVQPLGCQHAKACTLNFIPSVPFVRPVSLVVRIFYAHRKRLFQQTAAFQFHLRRLSINRRPTFLNHRRLGFLHRTPSPNEKWLLINKR